MLLFLEVKARQLCAWVFFKAYCRTAASELLGFQKRWGTHVCGPKFGWVFSTFRKTKFSLNQSFLEEFHSIGTLDAAWPLTRSVQLSLTGFSCNIFLEIQQRSHFGRFVFEWVHGPKNHRVSLKEKPVIVTQMVNIPTQSRSTRWFQDFSKGHTGFSEYKCF